MLVRQTLNTQPLILVAVTFLRPTEGGRVQAVHDSPEYRPHLVIGPPTQDVAGIGARGESTERYLGVTFMGDGRILQAGCEHEVMLLLTYYPDVDYSELREGATFTVREGPQVVGMGRVLRSAVNVAERRISDADQARIVGLLVQDLHATIGAEYDQVAADNAARPREFIEDTASYVQAVVDATQQDVHDEFIDTVWRRCPQHAHPLWFCDGAWWCKRDNIRVAVLGTLAGDSTRRVPR
jgi:hypothetical protein